MARILATGAAGFIGRALCAHLAAQGHHVIAAVRRPDAKLPTGIERRIVGEIGPQTAWRDALHAVEIVFHLAQRAHHASHASREAVLAGEAMAAVRLAEAAADCGARRLVYFSSIKAMGDATQRNRPFGPADEPRPQDAYGRAKLATERSLAAATGRSGIELTMIRPPLVYGPGVGGNFRALVALAGSFLPLPFAALDNRRSLVFLDNLVDLATVAAFSPQAAGRLLLVRDDHDLSTPELIRHLRAGLGRPARLFPLPEGLLSLLARLPRAGKRLQPLIQSLQVDDGATRAALGWIPPVAAAEGLARTARAFAHG